jgi:PhzF family phenazine biosynthesis protein
VQLFQVDAFTDRAFSGNPAAVCLLDGDYGDAYLQAIAAEMNLSETAFVRREGEGFALRWFTPRAEVDLCGHATLATAAVLDHLGLAAGEISFATRSGELRATVEAEHIALDFPVLVPTEADAPDGLAEALGANPIRVLASRFDLLVELATPAALRDLSPDSRALSKLPVRGVIVTSPSDEPAYDFLSRFFAPSVGVAEDPVTGSAHCVLAPFWAQRLGRSRLSAYQASARGGHVAVELNGERVVLRGQAVIVLRGELLTSAPPGADGARTGLASALGA